ncbi:MAG TPA: acyltransferase family protein [Mycobacteriales bacterium]|jgi:peptidoglycan/LPS O-acetylase OafA/YrhL|nr:acyltransferase family protein [Mycobacteriales bacterium]
MTTELPRPRTTALPPVALPPVALRAAEPHPSGPVPAVPPTASGVRAGAHRGGATEAELPVTVAAEALPVAAEPAHRPNRVPWIDGVRGAAACFVVLHHIWLASWPYFPENLGPWWLGWALYGHLAVAVFIVVSGFSLGLAPARHDWALRGGLRQFLRRRVWRILPPYWAALVFSMLMIALVNGPRSGEVVTAKTAAVYGLLVQDVIGAPVPNGTFWSIALEWQIYFVFPLVLLVARRFGLRWAVLLSGVAVLVVHVAAKEVGALARLDQLLPQFFGLFVLGVAAARVTVVPPSPRVTRLIAAGSAGAFAAFVGYAAKAGSPTVVAHYFWIDLLVGAAAAGMLATMAAGLAAPLRAFFGSRPLLRLGLFSYSIYLVHAPVLEALTLYVARPLELPALGTYGVLLAFVPVVLGFCYLFFLVFERPFLTARSFADLRGRESGRRPGRHARGHVSRPPLIPPNRPAAEVAPVGSEVRGPVPSTVRGEAWPGRTSGSPGGY